jgi:predicted amidohydrolase
VTVTHRTVRVAAVQLEPAIADVAENLRRCEALGDEAGAAGAEWIVLPEFFTTGMAYDERMADAVVDEDGPALALLRRLALRHGARVGGSFLCRDGDGHNRNAYLLVGPDGRRLGRHDKDLPTMWENCFYVGGDDDGVLDAGDGVSAGAAVCWELMRTQTAHRLRGRIDVLIAGSAWWSIPPWPPAPVTRRLEARNARTAAHVASAMAAAIGAPVIHAAHCGPIDCAMPLSPLRYRGEFEGGAVICDGRGTTVARRDRREGPGIVLADLALGRVAPTAPVPERFWMHRRGALPAFTWAYQRAHGRRWYARHALGRPVATVPEPAPGPRGDTGLERYG